MKKFGKVLLILLCFLCLVGCGTTEKQDNKEEKKEEITYLTGKYNVEMEVLDYGVVTIELDADVAPITVTNFVNLVKQGFYDGLTFHRIIDGFMVQGGASDKEVDTIKGEFLANGVKNSISHKRGVISMARAESYNSASSQFFIVHQDSLFLDGNYAAFGHVTSGMNVIDDMAEVMVEDSNGTVLLENRPIIKYIRLLDE